MGCSGACLKAGELDSKLDREFDSKLDREVGAPRLRPEISDAEIFQEREQESELVNAAADALPPEIVKKLSRQPSYTSNGKSSSSSRQGNKADRDQAPVTPPAEAGPGSKWTFNKSSSWFAQAPVPRRFLRGDTTNTMCSADSQREFAASSQTIIIFDWDDTLCPSTCMRPLAQFDRCGNLRGKLGRETSNELKLLSDRVLPLLRLAQTMGKVIMVTNAKSPWVDISCQSFLPALQGVLKEIPVFYALELIKAAGVDNFEGCLLKESKARAMREAVTQFYSQYPGQSWKNIVSIGDAYFEHHAIRQVVGEKGQNKPVRTKTIKMLEGPTIAGMVVQLAIIHSWLPQIIRADSDVDIDLSADEETVNKWVQLYGDLNSSVA